MVAAMSNIYLLHRVSVIQRRDNNKDNRDDEDNMENDDTDNIKADYNNVAEVFTSSLEIVTERPSDVTKCCDDNPTIQRRISYTDNDCTTQNERVEDLNKDH